MNQVTISGYVNYPKFSKTSTGKSKYVGNLAVYRKQENEKPIYDYIRFVSYEKVADLMNDWSDGAEVMLTGQWRHEKYEINGEQKTSDFLQVSSAGLVKLKRQEQPQYQPTYTNNSFSTVDDEVEEVYIPSDSLPF